MLQTALHGRFPTMVAHVGGGSGDAAPLVFPPWVIWVAGAGIVALSFLLIGAFLTRPAAERAPRSFGRAPDGRFAPALLLALLVLVGAFAFVPFDTPLPHLLLWTVLWSAVPLLAYTLGDIWPRIDPFVIIGRAAERLRGARPTLHYPRRLGVWPAVVLVIMLTAIEVASRDEIGAATLGRIVLSYLALAFVGAFVFGRDAWMGHAEAFGATMRIWAASSPLVVRDGRVRWRGADGLRTLDMTPPGAVTLVVAVLYGVNFDSFLATRVGGTARDALAGAVGPDFATSSLMLIGLAGFSAAFWLSVHFIRRAAETLETRTTIGARFAASLVPIAVGYHLAHNIPYLIAQAPRLAAAIIDPTASVLAAPIVLGATTALILATVQVLLIVGGHILAILGAHRLAVDGFPSRIQALRSELPLTGLMIFYTLVGLWIVTSATAGVSG